MNTVSIFISRSSAGLVGSIPVSGPHFSRAMLSLREAQIPVAKFFRR